MSFQAMTWAVDKDLPVKEKMTLMMLANRTNHDTGRCDPSHKRLAKDCGMSESSVKRSIANLAELGLIEIETRKIGDVNLPNQYILRFGGVGSGGTDLGSGGTQGVGSHRPTKQETNNQEVKTKPPTPSKDEIELPAWMPAEAWESFVEMRASLGAKGKLTEKAAKMVITELQKLAASGNDPKAVLEQSVINNWRGVFPLKNQSQRKIPLAKDFSQTTYTGTPDDQFADFLK